MNIYEDLLCWAAEQGIELTGIEPQTLPNKGTGIIATRDIQAGETILVVPFKTFRTLKHVPEAISRRLPQHISLHALLAACLTLDESDSYALPDKVLPDLSSIKASMPFFWPSELRSFLPKPAQDLLQKQRKKFQQDWDMISSEFSKVSHAQYLHSWMVVNTRSFYYTTPNMERLSHDDRLAMLPVADLFNHSDVGCELELSPDKYTFIADRKYSTGEEVYICYGPHSNDFLLAEYGFVPMENRWDVVCLDIAILPYLIEEQKTALREKGFLGSYILDPVTGGCFRTRVVMRLLCCTIEEWEQYLFFEAGEDFSHREKDLLAEILDTFVRKIHQTLKDVKNINVSQIYQRELLLKRWSQIETIVIKAMQDLDS